MILVPLSQGGTVTLACTCQWGGDWSLEFGFFTFGAFNQNIAQTLYKIHSVIFDALYRSRYREKF